MPGTPVALHRRVARVAHRLFVTSVVLVGLACAGPTAPDSFAGATAAPPAAAALQINSVLELTNLERRRAGIPEVHESTQLSTAAQLQTEQMGSTSVMDHILPNAPYPTPPDRLAAVNYNWEAYGENVAVGQKSGAEVVAAWMKSSGHRANILNPTYTELGVGYTIDESGRPYYAQVFAKPAR